MFWKLVCMLVGRLIFCLMVLIVLIVVFSDVCGVRLNEMVVVGNCFWWFIISELGCFIIVVNVFNGICWLLFDVMCRLYNDCGLSCIFGFVLSIMWYWFDCVKMVEIRCWL